MIENKPEIVDPEGDTILSDLILKNKKIPVKKIRSAKVLRFLIETKNKELAKKTVVDLCNDFRIYNPLVSKITVEAYDA